MVSEKVIFDAKKYQPDIWQRIVKVIASDRIGNAYLFSGNAGSGKEAIALAMGAALNCKTDNSACGKCSSCKRFATIQHEHLHVVVPLPRKKDSIDKETDVLSIIGNKNVDLLTELLQKKSNDLFQKIQLPQAKRILINSIREIRKKLYLKTVDFGYKIVVIFDAHYLSEGDGASANALLKILEEPPVKTTIILVTDHKSLLLSTIQSRCQHINFPPLPDNIITSYLEENGTNQEETRLYSYLADGNMHRARYLTKRSISDILKIMKEQVEDVINANGNGWRAYINKMSQLVYRDVDEFKLQLFLLQTWFQQSSRIRQNIHSTMAQNGFAESFQSFTNSYPHADLSAVNSEIETAIESINRNFYMPLTLTNMLVEIQYHLKGKP